MAARATWADVWRGSHRFTASWHFADIELEGGSLDAACFGFPPRQGLASEGSAQDCVVAKTNSSPVNSAILQRPTPSAASHSSSCSTSSAMYTNLCTLPIIKIAAATASASRLAERTVNLHSYWDTVVVGEIAADAQALATNLRGRITPAQLATWSTGAPRDWARESFAAAKSAAYTLDSPAGCDRDAALIPLPNGYDARARAVAADQIEKAGVRLARLLNDAFSQRAQTHTAPASTAAPHRDTRSPESIACSEQADQQNLHGKERRAFRRRCLRG